MATPVMTKRTRSGVTTVLSTDLCPRCGYLGHRLSDHVEEKARQCTKCACIAQSVDHSNVSN